MELECENDAKSDRIKICMLMIMDQWFRFETVCPDLYTKIFIVFKESLVKVRYNLNSKGTLHFNLNLGSEVSVNPPE